MSQQEWYVNFSGDIQGPFTPRELRELAQKKTITPATNIRLGIDGSWLLAESVNGLFASQTVRANPKPHTVQWSTGSRMPIVSTNEYIAPGWKIEATFPVVRARRVYGINAIADLKIAARDFFGGRSVRVEEAFESMEEEVLADLCEQSSTNGCHALTRLQVQHGVIERSSGIMLFITATATPVTLEHVGIED